MTAKEFAESKGLKKKIEEDWNPGIIYTLMEEYATQQRGEIDLTEGFAEWIAYTNYTDEENEIALKSWEASAKSILSRIGHKEVEPGVADMLDTAEEYYKYNSPEWHAFVKGYRKAQSKLK